ncbi:hypothetical protein [Enterobacter roggenkampii]|uniref:hypothetical protein n=1 Tax=Enterobacter roggenkampii TaxID=1812935 RepID=UPI00084BE211|nr:hypothetical protein [Enterobacter roggenkampii]AOP98001.1 hypothetical protein BFV67_22755 [Enterobacter roggenkampii]QWZ75399.1 hypothetical protein I6L60_22440 [Enterobacter roggenkampii]
MASSPLFKIGKLKFKSRKTAVTHYLAYEKILNKGPLKKGTVFEELKSLYLTYSECCEKWGIDSKQIFAFGLDKDVSQNYKNHVHDRRYAAHFLWKPVQSFSIRDAVNTIAKVSAESKA